MSSGASSLIPNWKVIRFPVNVSKEHSATDSSLTHNNVNLGFPFFFFLLAAFTPKGGDTLPGGSVLGALVTDVWLSLGVALLLDTLALAAAFDIEAGLVGVDERPSPLFCDVSYKTNY